MVAADQEIVAPGGGKRHDRDARRALIDELGWARASLDYLPFAAKIGQVLTPELQAAHAGTGPQRDPGVVALSPPFAGEAVLWLH
jgi:hypothetical protein